MKNSIIKSGLVICILCLIPASSLAQNQDSTRTQDNATDTTRSASTQSDDLSISFGEIELMEITIEAVIEKPRVSIIPKRLQPRLDEMEFVERSFTKELKKGPARPMMVNSKMQTPDKIEQIRKKIIAKKKKQKQNVK